MEEQHKKNTEEGEGRTMEEHHESCHHCRRRRGKRSVTADERSAAGGRKLAARRLVRIFLHACTYSLNEGFLLHSWASKPGSLHVCLCWIHFLLCFTSSTNVVNDYVLPLQLMSLTTMVETR